MSELGRQAPPRLDSLDRGELHDYFVDTWEIYELLFDSIRGEGALYEKPDPLRNPLIFYLGHTAAFYVNKLVLAGLLEKGIRPDFEELFAVGVDPAAAEELEEHAWPREEDVRDYRRAVSETVLEVIEAVSLDSPVDASSPAWALLMGCEHDRIHFETSSVLIRQHPTGVLRRPDHWRYAPLRAPDSREERASIVRIPVEAGRVHLGKPADLPTFGWDNEYGCDERAVAAFEVESDLVTNQRFQEFVSDGGYRRRELWSEEGWGWREGSGALHPRFWVGADGGFRYRAMFDELELPLQWPVEANAHEAAAFCRWLGGGARLLREAEFARLAEDAPLSQGDTVFGEDYNLNLAYGSPAPVGLLASGTTGRGVTDLYGNVWDWLADDFAPLPGFEPHPLYLDFSEPFFDDRHAMLLGGAWASTGTSASRFYRLWFRRHFFQHAGFRVARDLSRAPS